MAVSGSSSPLQWTMHMVVGNALDGLLEAVWCGTTSIWKHCPRRVLARSSHPARLYPIPRLALSSSGLHLPKRRGAGNAIWLLTRDPQNDDWILWEVHRGVVVRTGEDDSRWRRAKETPREFLRLARQYEHPQEERRRSPSRPPQR